MRILLAEDSKIYRCLIGGSLKEWGFELVVAQDGPEAWTILQEPETPKLALLDWVLPGMDGLELCRRIRSMQTDGSYIYVVMLTANDKKEHLIQTLEAGADDYLAKPFDPAELRLRLLAGKRLLDLHEQLVAARESVRIAATHDSLTGLLNRAEILSVLDRELDRMRRNHAPVAIVLVDVDHFKAVNDSLGHQAGDAVLKEVSKRLGSSLRTYDAVGRYGGEEFLLILPGCDLDSASRRAREIKEIVGREPIPTHCGTRSVTISAGVTVAESPHPANPQFVLEIADKALYMAKGNGRNRVETMLPCDQAVLSR
ncbi:MAG TPA: diguanylate cyclase [Terriglobales bacterium]|nr:diguanylate cyclase [Terriglobales bacterium]